MEMICLKLPGTVCTPAELQMTLLLLTLTDNTHEFEVFTHCFDVK